MTVVPLVLVGGGGHASDVLGVVEAINAGAPTWQVLGLLDDATPVERRFAGRGVTRLGPTAHLVDLDAAWVVAIGYPEARRRCVERLAPLARRTAATLVHPAADVGAGVELAEGCVVIGQARLSPNVVLGAHACVSYLASVGHESVVGAGSTVMPGAVVAGDVTLGTDVLVGAGAVVLEGRTVGDGARIGAGAVVTTDVAAGATVVGAPAVSRRGS